MGLEVRASVSYEAHPLLDPDLSRKRSGLIRLWFEEYRALQSDPAASGKLTANLISSDEGSQIPFANSQILLELGA